MKGIEKKHLTLGFMPLSDCAPLVVAQELGLYQHYGLQVTLSKQNSWATLRDKMQARLLDAAQMLAPMPLITNFQYQGENASLLVPFILSYNGNAITLSRNLYDSVATALAYTRPRDHQDSENSSVHKHEPDIVNAPFSPLSAKHLIPVIQARKASGQPPLKFAAVYPYGCQYYQLLHWLKTANANLENEISLHIVPPSGMVPALEEGAIDGFCAGGPWSAQAIRKTLGVTVITANDIWSNQPEKVLSVTQAWQTQNPNSLLALIKALSKACQWLESIPNRFEAARWLARPEYLNLPLDVIAPGLLGSCLIADNESPRSEPDYYRFGLPGMANEPLPDNMEVLLNTMLEHKHLPSLSIAHQVAAKTLRQDIYWQALSDSHG